MMVILTVCIIAGSFLPYRASFDGISNFYGFFTGAFGLVILIPIFSLFTYLITVREPWFSVVPTMLSFVFIELLLMGRTIPQGIADALNGIRGFREIGYSIMLFAALLATAVTIFRLAIAIAEHVAKKDDES